MNISAVPSGSIAPLSDSRPASVRPESGNPSSFVGLLQDMIKSTDAEQVGVDHQTQRLLTGETTGFHELSMAVARADLSFQFLLGVRDQLIGAYREVMRMQV